MRKIIIILTLLAIFASFSIAGGNQYRWHFSDGTLWMNGTDVCVNNGGNCLSDAGGSYDLDVAGDSGTGAVTNLETLSILGGSGISTALVGDTFTITNTGGGGGGDQWDISTSNGLYNNSNILEVQTSYIQRRVSGTCAAGNSIREIAIDGTVTCESDSDTTCDGGSCSIANTGTLDGYNAAALLDDTYNTSADMINAVNISSYFDHSIDWNNLINVPAGFADDTDNVGAAAGENYWVDGGNYLYPNSSYGDNLIVYGYIYADDWTNVSITESQISDLSHTVDTNTNADTICTGTSVYLDGEGNCDTVVDTDTQLTEEEVEDFVGGMLGGTETFITVTYQDATNDIDFVVSDSWWDSYSDFMGTTTASNWCQWDGSEIDCNVAPVSDTDTQLTENEVEDFVFDSDNTANLGMGSYNVTAVECIVFDSGGSICSS